MKTDETEISEERDIKGSVQLSGYKRYSQNIIWIVSVKFEKKVSIMGWSNIVSHMYMYTN